MSTRRVSYIGDWTEDQIESLESHRRRMAAEESFEVRIVGGIDALRAALSGHDHSIATRAPHTLADEDADHH